MNNKVRIYLLSFLLLASTVAIVGSGESSALTPPVFQIPSVAWNGFVTILPDGAVSDLNAPIQHTGNHYDLTGNINGTLTVQYAGAIINGHGYTVWNTMGMPPVTLSGANSIILENMTVAAWYSTAINIVSSSYDTITNNTVEAMVTGIFVFSPYNEVVSNFVNVSLTYPGYSGLSTGIMVRASSTSVTGNTVILGQAGAGIIIDAGLSSVYHNDIAFNRSNSQGIVSNGASNDITNNTIAGAGSDSAGINMQLGTQTTSVLNNIINITGQRTTGISVQDGFNSVDTNMINVAGSYSYGITVLSSGTGSNVVEGNLINCTGQNSIGIYDTSHGTTVSKNSIAVNGSYARGITAVNNLEISGNDVYITGDYTYGISSLSGTVVDNRIMANGSYTYGIYSSGGESALFSFNTINSSGYHAYGVLLDGQFQTFSGNTIEAGNNSGIGMIMNALVNSIVANNSISYTSTGIQSLSHSSYDITFQGNFLYNDTVAFKVAGVSTNLFFHNSFINYTSFQVTGSTGNAIWDNGYPSGGNFWSGYNGTDLFSGPSQNITGSDGIGDSQFNVTSNNVDHYPLMAPWNKPTVTFVESGLAAGTSWSVNFSGVERMSNSTSISFDITNAVFSSYGYNVASVPGYTHSPETGSVDYTGNSIVNQVVFEATPQPSYTITFTQSGLPSGTQWSVTLGESTLQSTGSTISFDPVNGTYSYGIGGVPGYSADSYGGSVVVDGQDTGVSVTFTQVTYSVTFKTLGLPSGMTWYLNLSSGQSFSSTESELSFILPNGTYSYSVDNVSDYNSTPAAGTFTVSGNSPAPIQISFDRNASVPPAVPANNNPNIWAYIIGIIIGGAVVGVSAVVIYYVRKR